MSGQIEDPPKNVGMGFGAKDRLGHPVSSLLRRIFDCPAILCATLSGALLRRQSRLPCHQASVHPVLPSCLVRIVDHRP